MQLLIWEIWSRAWVCLFEIRSQVMLKPLVRVTELGEKGLKKNVDSIKGEMIHSLKSKEQHLESCSIQPNPILLCHK